MIFISTHQIRDLDNLIDRVVIVDNGKLLLDASLQMISEKLCFKTVADLPATLPVFYSEESLKGHTIVVENVGEEDCKVNLEHLFNAVTENPGAIQSIFQKQNLLQ
jgi:ABC-2 type transport system ATP-binding protein